jgi:cell wall-associated NlpC family hydrolase
LALVILTAVCFLFSLTTSLLGEQAQMEVKPIPTPTIQAAQVPSAPSEKLELSPIEAPKPNIGLLTIPSKPLEPYVEGRPKPTPPPKPTPKPLTQVKVAELKQTNPGLVTRIISATKGLIGRAISWLGTQYVWGGISKKGVDCSGLTRLLYLSEGIVLPHSVKLQYRIGQTVAQFALLPGDLVFFNTTGPLSHVGMYIGNGRFLHAANPRRGVRIDDLNSKYYNKRFAGARRYKSFG